MLNDLREKLGQIIQHAVVGQTDLMVLVPHRNDLRAVQALVADLLFDKPTRSNTWVVQDDYVRVYLNVVSSDAGKGQSFSYVMIPDDTLLTSKKRKELKTYRQSYEHPTVNMVPYL